MKGQGKSQPGRRPGHIYVGATELRRRRGRRVAVVLMVTLAVAALLWLLLG